MSYNIIFPLYIHTLKCVKESPVSIFKVKDCQLSRTEKKEYIWKKIFHSISLTIIIRDISFSKRLIRFYSIIFILHLSTLKIFFYSLIKLQIKIFLFTVNKISEALKFSFFLSSIHCPLIMKNILFISAFYIL